MSAERLTLKVGGQIYGGWKSVAIRTGIEQIAGSFELAITERWPNQPTDWVIPPGEFCEVEIGDEAVISGYVDSVAVSYDDRSHEIQVSGRDRTGDLVDCSAPSLAFSGLTFDEIARRLCEPYGITVRDETAARRQPVKLPKQAAQNGETVFKTLEKLARNEGVLLVSDGAGALVITRAGLGGRVDTVLELGKNILRASLEHSHANLYSEITVKGQAAAAGADRFEVIHAGPKGTVKRPAGAAQSGNSQIARYRPLILVAETQADAGRCQQRAEWEAGNREAKAKRLSITVQGWRDAPGGALWRANRTLRVRCPWLRLDEDWLISGVSYRLDEGGTTAELSLVSEKAFDRLPEIPQPEAGAASSGKTRQASGKYQVIGK